MNNSVYMQNPIYVLQQRLDRIREINNELVEQYPECGQYCKAIEEVISENKQS